MTEQSAPIVPVPEAPVPAREESASAASENRAWAVAVAGWLVPGLGHALQRMWGRAFVVFVAVGLLVLAGASMRGNVFTSNGNDAFDMLGYIADLGTGVLNLLAALHAFEAARGRKA